MIIKLKYTKTTYDLSQETRFRNFSQNVSTMLRKANRDSELRNILEQLENAPDLPDKANKVKLKIKQHFAGKDRAEPKKKIDPPLHKTRKLEQWQKTGEHSFQRMYVRLIDDVKEFHGNFDFMLAYSAHIINMFMHMATVTPHQHHAASQQREYNTKYSLQYGRSQGRHPNAVLYRTLGGFATNNRLPFNGAYYKILKDIDPKGFLKISQFEPITGAPKPGKIPGSYANLAVAHAGVRRNNLAVLLKGLSLASREGDNPTQAVLRRLSQALPVPRKSFKKSESFACIFQAYREQFKQLAIYPAEKAIGRNIMSYRLKRVSDLEAKINLAKFAKISVKKTQKNTTCLYLRFYPKLQSPSNDFDEGVTNTLIAIFSGILQNKLEQKNICIRAERRQSFGFLRPTLTDAGVLTMRLSLGIEPTVFDEVVLDSLAEMDKLLTIFDFQKNTNDTVRKVLAIKNYDPQKTNQYSYIHSAVASDSKTLTTFNQAQAYIRHYTQNGTLTEAIQHFLSDFILEDKTLPISICDKKTSEINTKPKEVIGLLQNTIAYAKKMATSLTFDGNNCPFKHTYLHAYKKLYKNVNEAMILLNNQDRLKGDDIFQKATRYIENIIEYSLILNTFNYQEQVKKDPTYDPIKILKQTELQYCANHLGLNQNQLRVFFTDSGQQAINLPMLVYGNIHKHSNTDNACIHLFGDTYFEISKFFDDIKKNNVPTTTRVNGKAKVLVVDISQIQQFQVSTFPNLATCIIDITHQPDVNNPNLREKIDKLLDKGVTVVLSSSLLKHEQLGQDKYQSGRFFLISPKDNLPSVDTIDEFQSVSDEAMNPYLACAFNLFNQISDVKFENKGSPLYKLSLFHTTNETPTQNTNKPHVTPSLSNI